MVSMVIKEIMKLMVFGCGEELRFPTTGLSITLMNTLNSPNSTLRKKLIKLWQLSTGLTSTRETSAKEETSSMQSGTDDDP